MEEAKKRIFRRKQHHEQSDTGSFGWAVLGFFIPMDRIRRHLIRRIRLLLKRQAETTVP